MYMKEEGNNELTLMNEGGQRGEGLGDDAADKQSFPEHSLNYQVQAHWKRYFLALFMLGIFNNYGFVLVQSGAQSLAETFQMQNFMAVF